MDLVQRVKQILLSPRTEWQVIEAEPTTTAELYKTYIIPLAAIGPSRRSLGIRYSALQCRSWGRTGCRSGRRSAARW